MPQFATSWSTSYTTHALTPKAHFPSKWLFGLFVTLDDASKIAVIF
jgi:hypothetical protein